MTESIDDSFFLRAFRDPCFAFFVHRLPQPCNLAGTTCSNSATPLLLVVCVLRLHRHHIPVLRSAGPFTLPVDFTLVCTTSVRCGRRLSPSLDFTRFPVGAPPLCLCRVLVQTPDPNTSEFVALLQLFIHHEHQRHSPSVTQQIPDH